MSTLDINKDDSKANITATGILSELSLIKRIIVNINRFNHNGKNSIMTNVVKHASINLKVISLCIFIHVVFKLRCLKDCIEHKFNIIFIFNRLFYFLITTIYELIK